MRRRLGDVAVLGLGAAVLLAPGRAAAVYACGDAVDDCQCGHDDPYPCCDNGGNCTWWAWRAACCAWGEGMPGWGNANQWAGKAALNPDYEVLPYPVINSVGCRVSGEYGHVAFVVDVNGSQITITEQSCWGAYGTQTVTRDAARFDGGYIVLKDQVQCRPGATTTAACGACGELTRTCDKYGHWQDGACVEHQPGPCDTGQPGVCAAGQLVCEAGTAVCVPDAPPVDESCDTLDNDCDGDTDEDQICEIDAASQLLWDVSTDLDGDGRADACARSAAGFSCHRATGHGFDPVALPEVVVPGGVDAATRPFLGDLDGDGRADLCGSTPGRMRCWLSTGVGFGQPIDGPQLSDAERADPSIYATVRLIDVTGDHRADLCLRTSAGFSCRPWIGAGFGEPVLVAGLGDAAGWNQSPYYGTLRAGDVNGDGRADLCGREAQGMTCWLAGANGTTFTAVAGPAWSDADGWSAVERYTTIRLADVNGDGRADLCARASDGFRCHLARSDGTGFGDAVPGPALDDASGWNQRIRFATIRMGDLDGDGTADVCARGAEGITCWLWTGSAFDRVISGPALTDADGWDQAWRYRTLRLADVNGDGKADLVARSDAGLRAWLSGGVSFATLVLGPAWSDAEGWNAAASYDSIRVAGGERRADADGGNVDGGCGCLVGARGGRGHARGIVVGLAFLSVLGAAVVRGLRGRRPLGPEADGERRC